MSITIVTPAATPTPSFVHGTAMNFGGTNGPPTGYKIEPPGTDQFIALPALIPPQPPGSPWNATVTAPATAGTYTITFENAGRMQASRTFNVT
jgi:hypothetical protein